MKPKFVDILCVCSSGIKCPMANGMCNISCVHSLHCQMFSRTSDETIYRQHSTALEKKLTIQT